MTLWCNGYMVDILFIFHEAPSKYLGLYFDILQIGWCFFAMVSSVLSVKHKHVKCGTTFFISHLLCNSFLVCNFKEHFSSALFCVCA